MAALPDLGAQDAPNLSDNHESIQEQLLIRNWLSTVPYLKHHRAKTEMRLPGSCTWLFQKEEFRKWRISSASSILWLHGIPGSGKSMLTFVNNFHSLASTYIDRSSVIEMFRGEDGLNSSPTPMAFFYCARDPVEPERADPEEIISCILKQLSSSDNGMPIREPVTRRYIKRKNEAKNQPTESLELNESVETILELLEENPATIIIDALDECNPQDQQLLLLQLHHLIHNSSNQLKILVSSRDDHNIVNHLGSSPNIYISTKDNQEDIQKYVNSQINIAIERGNLLGGEVSQVLKKDVIKSLISQANGMFRLVSLHIEALCNSQQIRSAEDVYQALGKLPKKLHDSYDHILSQIFNSEASTQELASRVIKWLWCAQTQLSTKRFINIVKSGPSNWSRTITVSDVLRACCNLVILDSEQDTFRFAHLSVREYLEKSWDVSSCHAWVFEQCIYGYFHYSEDPSLSYLYNYSAQYGPVHHRIHHETSTSHQLSENLKQWLRHFFFQSLSFPKWIVKSDKTYNRPRLAVSHQHRGQMSQGQILSKHDWGQTVKCLLDIDLSGELQQFFSSGSTYDASESDTPLQAMLLRLVILGGGWEIMESDHLVPYIASLGMDNLTLFMLRMGADINDRDFSGRGVLTYAINTKNDDMILKLIRRGADCLARDSEGIPDLHLAARTGYKFAVQQFLNTGVSVNSSSSQNETALMTAAANGHASIVEMLLENGAGIHHKNYVGENALHLAVPLRNIITIKRLVDADVTNINITDHLQRTALHLAAGIGDAEIISALLYAGADFSRKNQHGEIPVQVAARHGHIRAVMLLLEEETDPDTKIKNTTKAFNAAVSGGQSSLVRKLSIPSVPISDVAVRGTLLNFANKLHLDDFSATAEFLVGALENINAQNEAEETILHQAANNSYPSLIKILLKLGARTEIKNSYGETALHIAAKRGTLLSITLLLDAGADTEAATFGMGYTALHKAAEAGHLDAVKMLIERGANINAERSGGETAAHLAITKEFETIASYLINKM